MRAEIAFRRKTVVNVDAAVVGISRARWVASPPDESVDDVREKMESEGFDILPIAAGSQPVREYFSTSSWGDFSTVTRASIQHRDTIQFDTPLPEVMRRFAEEERHFFFLVEEHEIAGLISVANLNCRQVSLFILGLLVELEVRLGIAVAAHFGREIETMLLSATGEKRTKDVLQRIESDRAKGLDAPLIEYLYLSDLVRLAETGGLHTELGYSKTAFSRESGSLVDLRNRVAHPTRSLLTSDHGVGQLWNRIDRADALLFALRQ